MLQHKVTYLKPGSFFAEDYTRAIERRDPALAARLADDDVFAFTFHDVEPPPDLDPDFTVIPTVKNKSGRYYLGGTVYTVDDVEALPGDHQILVSNMRGNGWDRVVHCRTGNWQPLEDVDVVLDLAAV